MITEKELYNIDGNLPGLKYSLPLAFQHLVAMIVGCVTPAIIIAGVAGLDPASSILLIQSSLIFAAISTLIQLFTVTKFVGAKLPLIMGVSFAYLSSMQAIVQGFGLAEIFGAQLVGGLIAIVVGIFAKQLKKLFPPLITGTVVFTIGLSLYPTAINYMAGGVGSATYGSFNNWFIAVITLVVVVTLNHFGKGGVKLASILIGIIFGYIVSIFFGMIDISAVGEAGWFAFPKFAPFGIKFEPSAIIAFSILFVINSVQAIGDMNATTVGAMKREATDSELRGGIIGFGLSNFLASLFGALPVATFSQNVGIVTTTKVVNRKVLGITALLLVLAGFCPKFSALLTTIPQCVLGGATISVFSSIAMTGMKLVTSEKLNFRNSSIVGLSAALGMGISQASGALSQFPEWVTMIFAKSPVVLATIVAVALNIILPKEEDEKEEIIEEVLEVLEVAEDIEKIENRD